MSHELARAPNILDAIAALRDACDARDLDARIVITIRGDDGAESTVETASAKHLRRRLT